MTASLPKLIGRAGSGLCVPRLLLCLQLFLLTVTLPTIVLLTMAFAYSQPRNAGLLFTISISLQIFQFGPFWASCGQWGPTFHFGCLISNCHTAFNQLSLFCVADSVYFLYPILLLGPTNCLFCVFITLTVSYFFAAFLVSVIQCFVYLY